MSRQILQKFNEMKRLTTNNLGQHVLYRPNLKIRRNQTYYQNLKRKTINENVISINQIQKETEKTDQLLSENMLDLNFENNEAKISNKEEYIEEEVVNNEEFTQLFDQEKLNKENDLTLKSGKKYRSIVSNQRFFEETNYEFIYEGSRLTVQEFNLYFRWACQKMNLSKVDRHFLINLIKALLPRPNKIPSSYYSLVKSLQKEKCVSKKCFKICSKCYGHFYKKCEDANCENPKKTKSIDALVFDFETHLTKIITRNWKNIQEYKSKFSK